MVLGKVYIASMNMRGTWATAPDNALKLNVTSAQAKNNKNRRDFSPMTEIEGGFHGYWNFEAFWQSGKVFEDIPDHITKTFWKNITQPKRRYPGSKNKKVLYAKFDSHPGEKMDYITSRKKVYVPYYYNLMRRTEMAAEWKRIVAGGQDIVIYDFDGPRTKSGNVSCCECSRELLIEKMNDPTFPFGHGYIVAGYLMGISVPKLC